MGDESCTPHRGGSLIGLATLVRWEHSFESQPDTQHNQPALTRQAMCAMIDYLYMEPQSHSGAAGCSSGVVAVWIVGVLHTADNESVEERREWRV